MQTAGGLGRLRPLPRFVAFVVLSAVTTFFTYNWTGLLLSTAVVLALLIAGRRFPKAGLVSAGVAGLLTFMGNLFAPRGGAPLLALGPLAVTTGSLESASLFGVRLTTMILLAVAYIAVTPTYELLLTGRALRIPSTAEIYLIIVLRYIDVLRYEFTTAMRAMAIRGVRWNGSLLERADGLRKLPVPIIYRLMGHIHSQALAIDSRGGIKVATGGEWAPQDGIALRLENVSATYDLGDPPDEESMAIRGLSLEVSQGEHALILGRTGAGKSTLLLLAAGLIPHSTGRMAGAVRLFGADTRQSSMSQLSRLARIVFPSAVQGLVGITVRDELALSVRVRGLPPERREALLREILAEVGLDESFMSRETLALSGGEMQRVALASALVARPALLLLDEVTAQLDPVGRREVQEVLRRIGHETTVLMADLNALPGNVDRLVLLEAGNVVSQGHPLQITNEQLAKAGFRVPQLRRLAQTLDIPEVAAGGAQAVEALRGCAADAARPRPPEPAPRPVLLEARRLTFQYTPERPLLSGLDVRFARGEFTAILGSNGSGKTTLSLLLAGVLSPAAGEVVAHAETPEGRRVGYIFQEPTFQMLAGTVEDEIAFGPRQLGWSEEEVQAVVERERARFHLPLGVNPVNLPPAQARQLAIASVLAISPSVLILDEPTNGLDEIETRALMEILVALHREGQTILLITHDVEIACEYAERILVMSEGQIRLDGAPAEVMSHSENLRECDVMPPPVVELSRALWPGTLPAVSVAEFAGRLRQSGAVSPREVVHTLEP